MKAKSGDVKFSRDDGAAFLQMNLLKGLIQQHRLEWSKSFKECQPLITLVDHPPSFMRVLNAHCNGRFLVISNTVVNKIDPLANVNSEKQEVVAPVGLEIEGCPLECPFTEEEMDLLNSKLTTLNKNFFPLDIYTPLPVQLARNIMLWYGMEVAKFCRANQFSQHDLASVIVVCIGGPTVLSSCLFGSGSLTCISDTTLEAKSLGNLNASDMKVVREKIFNQVINSGAELESSVLRAEYLQQTHLKEGTDPKADCFHVKMAWANPKNFNSDIPTTQLAGTEAKIEITLQNNYSHWQTGKIWEEIHLLQYISGILKQDSVDPSVSLPCVDAEPTGQTILEMLNSNLDLDTETDLESLSNLFKIVGDGHRPCSDLTDAVWNSIKNISMINDVAIEIENVMKHSVIHDFLIQSCNNSDLGKICVGLFKSKDATLISVPTPKQTLTYMMQIGLLKVKRDFLFIAQQSEMMILNVISKALQGLDDSETIRMLSQVHQAFEVVLRAEEWLHLKKDGLVDMFIKSLETPVLDNISLLMSAFHLVHIISSYEPVIRSWELELKIGGTKMHQTFVASQYPLFSWTMPQLGEDESHAEVKQEQKFYCAQLTEQKRPVRIN
ncbi:uncharacterized protein LOC132199119 [Neocloeon triangulifer]|uniref:uncharacterized protein LOC132199119 n=1 Tax=Neocloeon triangulifer TaxID=2078957 RepID=UPI00286EBA53|nr:uncharacterized protein LOC132199119 [Neocloeon triangulifer]XP_059479598.1 uncharacterized protein LOC132199119 [Neocloeon triangulifer]XP_059479599.1 uncharacterized protein LOC132199119 [Neocloeon triangulifer]